MAVTEQDIQAPTQFFTALSSDTRPTADVEPWAVLLETDTGQRWQYDGAAWAKVSETSLTLALLAGINQNLERLLSASISDVADDDN